jgi:hypothetical protein
MQQIGQPYYTLLHCHTTLSPFLCLSYGLKKIHFVVATTEIIVSEIVVNCRERAHHGGHRSTCTCNDAAG